MVSLRGLGLDNSIVSLNMGIQSWRKCKKKQEDGVDHLLKGRLLGGVSVERSAMRNRLFTLRREHLGTIGLNNQAFCLLYWEDLLQEFCNSSVSDWTFIPCGRGKTLILKETVKTTKPSKYTICLKTLLHFGAKI